MTPSGFEPETFRFVAQHLNRTMICEISPVGKAPSRNYVVTHLW